MEDQGDWLEIVAEYAVGKVVVSQKGAQRLAQGHPWVYKSDLQVAAGLEAGIVEVVGPQKRPLGWGLLSPESQITLRFLSRTPVGPELVEARVAAALKMRQSLMPAADAFRWIHGEADLLPGVFVDRYADAVSIQFLCAGAEAIRPWVLQALQSLMPLRLMVVRNDSGARQREGLSQKMECLKGEAPAVVRYHEGSIEFEVDLLDDQKTGGFLDQTANHVWAGTLAKGRALDCFTYHGGFALQMAKAGAKVTAIDISERAIGRVQANAKRAGLTLEARAANVFDLLPTLASANETYDTIVLDPPAFASTKASVDKAMRAYKEINRRAMQLLKPGGILISCSCSGRVSAEMFDEMLHAAALESKRSVQLLERRGAGLDHPVLLGVPETEYLKCRAMRVSP